MAVMAVSNAKGGSGKSTLAVHLAGGLARLGASVLLIDTDGQLANAGTLLALERRPALTDWLRGRALTDCVQPVPSSPGLDVVTTDQTILAVATTAPADQLRRALGDAAGYDFVVIDTQPSLGALPAAALAVSDFVLVATIAEYGSLIGINHVVGLLRSVQRQGAAVELLGIVPVMVDARLLETRRALAELGRTFGGLVYPTIRRTVRVSEAARRGVFVWDYAPGHDVVSDFEAVVTRFLQDTKGVQQ